MMICKFCAANDEKSSVFVGSHYKTLMNAEHFFDPEGREHVHDPNTIGTIYRCSNGHRFVINRKTPCPNCAVGHEPEVIESR